MSIEAFYIITLDNVILLIIWIILWAVERFKFLDDNHSSLEWRQIHYVYLPSGGVAHHDGEQREEHHQEFLHQIAGFTGVTIGLTILPLSSSPLSLLLNSKVCSHGVEPKLSSTTTRNLWASSLLAV